MKKIARIVAVVMVVALIACAFTACGSTRKGTYKSTDALGGTLTFDKDQKVTGELFGITLDGTYEIKDGEITFKYSGIAGIGATLTKSFEKDGGNLIIDGQTFEKQ